MCKGRFVDVEKQPNDHTELNGSGVAGTVAGAESKGLHMNSANATNSKFIRGWVCMVSCVLHWHSVQFRHNLILKT